MSIVSYYKIVKPQSELINAIDNQDVSGNTAGSYSWYHRLIQGSPSRLIKYREYDSMDNDIDVNRALDIIAQEVAGNAPKSSLPVLIQITAEEEQFVKSSTVVTLKAALKTWCKIHDWENRLYITIRNTLKYGDQFYVRPKKKFKKLVYVPVKHVQAATVRQDDITDIAGWAIKSDFKKISNFQNGGAYSIGTYSTVNQEDASIDYFTKDEVVRFTLNSEMTDEAPFGESVLRAVYKTFKQKELLEDALLIYRIQRAPEKKVFKIDVGNMHASKVAHFLETTKNDFRQKKIPTDYYGRSSIESTYNPSSMCEDFFVAKRGDKTGTEIEILPAGQNLGQLEDLDYFYNKIWRGLKIPKSYIDTTEGGGTFNDGAVGIAYQQEIIFSLYVEQLQKQIETTLDAEFKKFLDDQNIQIDKTIFNVVLPEPSNFAKSKMQQINSKLIQDYVAIVGDEFMSPRFAAGKYLGLTKEEIIMNQRMKMEEMGIDPNKATKQDLIRIYNKDKAEEGGFDGGIGGDPGLNVPIEDEEGEQDLDNSDGNLDDTNTQNKDDKNKQ